MRCRRLEALCAWQARLRWNAGTIGDCAKDGKKKDTHGSLWIAILTERSRARRLDWRPVAHAGTHEVLCLRESIRLRKESEWECMT